MKQLLFAFIVMAMLISCNNPRVAGSNEKNDHASIAERNAEKTKAVYRAIETGDVSKIDTLFTDDVVDHNAGPQGQDIRGRDSVIAMLGQIHNYFDGLKLELMHHATSSDGQYHYSTVRMTGKAKENPWGMPVGMDMDDTSVDVIKLKDGKAAEHWGFMSMGDVMEMMQGMSGGQQPASKDKAKQ
ncbi:MAG TPA: nuclear transport factor 2 family protein [Flavisolibacter sp.]|nr:nuclear transport factor 2 family protein [Flavisolibacter sp.]